MSKVTKNERIHALEQQVKFLIDGYKILSQHVDFTFEYEPKLKQLDQSVFDGTSNDKRFFAVDEDGKGWFYRDRPSISGGGRRWMEPDYTPTCAGTDYDASNWKNSLIEREKKELIGSELCKAMLARGDKYVSGFGHHKSDDGAVYSMFADTVTRYSHCFHSAQNSWDYFVPINNQGEPLTQAEAGL